MLSFVSAKGEGARLGREYLQVGTIVWRAPVVCCTAGECSSLRSVAAVCLGVAVGSPESCGNEVPVLCLHTPTYGGGERELKGTTARSYPWVAVERTFNLAP